MNIVKITKDQILKWIWGKRIIPKELLELHQYCSLNGFIGFTIIESEDDFLIAKSNNFRYGSIVTSGKDLKELDNNIKDAILTAFDIPSVYLAESKLHKKGSERELNYALA